MTDVRFATHPSEFDHLHASALRERFLLEELFVPGEVRFALSHHDRILIGGAMPAGRALDDRGPARGARRGAAATGASSASSASPARARHRRRQEALEVQAEDILYVGAGPGPSAVSGDATYYLVSAPAHEPLPTTLIRRDDAETVPLGDPEHANMRTLPQVRPRRRRRLVRARHRHHDDRARQRVEHHALPHPRPADRDLPVLRPARERAGHPPVRPARAPAASSSPTGRP